MELYTPALVVRVAAVASSVARVPSYAPFGGAEAWEARTTHRADLVQVHRSEVEADGWVREQHELLYGRK